MICRFCVSIIVRMPVCFVMESEMETSRRTKLGLLLPMIPYCAVPSMTMRELRTLCLMRFLTHEA